MLFYLLFVFLLFLQDLRGYNEKSDIYSLGMTICELANGIEPFYEMSETLMLTEKVRGSVPYLIDQSTFPIDSIDIKQSMVFNFSLFPK